MPHPNASLHSDQAAAGSTVPAVPRLAPSAASPRPCVRSDELLRGGQEIDIAHGDAVYRLRVTALGRLILTK